MLRLQFVVSVMLDSSFRSIRGWGMRSGVSDIVKNSAVRTMFTGDSECRKCLSYLSSCGLTPTGIGTLKWVLWVVTV